MCMGLLGPTCSSMMRRMSGWEGLLQMQHGPHTTALVPSYSTGCAGPGPKYAYRSSVWGGGGTVGMGPRVIRGVPEREGAFVLDLIPN